MKKITELLSPTQIRIIAVGFNAAAAMIIVWVARTILGV
jgi:hypothetical protein